jgi:hypothetical protein
MNNQHIEEAINDLEIGFEYVTPDNARGVPFSIDAVTADQIRITLNSGNSLVISRLAFFAANDFLHNNSHDVNHPALIGSSNEAEESGLLCAATRAMNNGIRCINYIVPILRQFGVIGFSGIKPNTCWYVNT